jgi:hypothetical protein
MEIFTDEQKTALNELIEKKARELNSQDTMSFGENSEHWRKDAKRLRLMTDIWKNSGRTPTGERVALKDLLEKDAELTLQMRDNFSTDHPLLIPRVISNIARDAIEPNLVLTPLMTRIQFSAGTYLTFPAWGAMTAADIPEGGEYPERSIDLAGQVTATIGKSGVAFKVVEEVIRYSQYDVLSAHARAAGRALARHKEVKVANLIVDNGTVLIDNDTSGPKSSTGRDPAGSYNGTLTLDDLFWAHAQMVDTGFTPNTFIMHPFAWQIFAQEGIARAFGFINGMSPLMWQMPQGSPGNASQWRQGNLNQNTYVSSPQNIASTFTNVPSIFPTTYRIIVSPFMPYNASNDTTTIAMCDSNELGILVVDEEVMTDQWDDPARDITKVKLRERYGLAIQNNGYGVGLLKNIKIAKSYDFSNNIQLSLTGLGNSLTGDAALTGDIIA